MNIILPGTQIAATATAGTANASQFIERFETRRDQLPGDPAARINAADWLRRHGLPRRTEEAWKYTALRPLWETRFEDAPATDPAAALHALLAPLGLAEASDDLPRLVFVDGRLSPDLSHLTDRLLFTRFGGVASAEPVRHPMVALSTMLSEDGATIHVPAGVDAGQVLLVALGTGGAGASAFHLRHRFVLEQGASLSLIEIAGGSGTYLHNTVTDFEVASGAHARHVRLQQDAPSAFSFSLVRTHLGERATYDSFNLALGAALARHEVHATLAGSHGAVHVNGAQLLDDRQVADLTSVISHNAPNCNSRQTVKNVLSGSSRGVFQGKIFVARVAQKTDGYQMNQALLLSETAEIDAKPELEIYADDVKCSHGATAGALDEEQLFYMRSRGVPEIEARAILVRAFLDDALALVEDERARSVLDLAVARWWDGRTG